jgi:N12 class adenine-specific DNA methylase
MTRIAGLPNTQSQRALDMFLKFRWLQGNGGKVVGLTGTPVTNTIAELYTMQRYFQLETLEDLGLSHFDAWANQFALAEPGLEMTPDGAGFRMNTRFRKFVNLPEMLAIWSQVADCRTIDAASGITRPDLYGNGPVKVVTPGNTALKDYVLSLAARAEAIHAGRVDPKDDNMLKVAGDGRKAALDMSLVAAAPPGAPMPKVDALADLVARIYRASTPVRGTQLIFCDLATPKAKG